MGAVARLVRLRLAHRWVVLVIGGLLLGLVFGVAFSSLATARRTASAYDRVLLASDAEDATVSHELSPEEAEAAFDGVEGIAQHRYRAGFVGSVAGIDPALTRVLLASGDDGFAVEDPVVSAGRLPAPDRADEVFVNGYLADQAGLTVGQELPLELRSLSGEEETSAPVTIVGIGSIPREAVIDETESLGFLFFSRAFAEAHRDLAAYAASRLYLEPGVDAVRDVAPQLGPLDLELTEIRTRDREGLSDALRPTISLLVAVGVLALAAGALGAGQIAQREQDRWRSDDRTAVVLGMTRRQILLVRLGTASVTAAVAAGVALAVLVASSPIAPVGPLHIFDPGQGVGLDLAVAGAGLAVVLAAIVGATAGFAASGGRRAAPAARASSVVAAASRRPEAAAGLTLALRARGGRRRLWRSVGFAAASVAVAAAVTTLVVSAAALSGDPYRYGVTWDVVAVNAYGDQLPSAQDAVFADDPDVEAAAGFAAANFVIDGIPVPGLAVTPVAGAITPTVVAGGPLVSDDQILLGRETMSRLGVMPGDTVDVQAAGLSGQEEFGVVVPLEVVGAAVFPAISQTGTDQARLGTGALVTGRTFDGMLGNEAELPEWTAARLVDGADPQALIDRNPGGVEDGRAIPTSWYTDAKPAELIQLDAVRSVLLAAVAASALIVVAVAVYSLWFQARANRRGLSVLWAIGFTRRQLDEAVAWQAVPMVLATVLIGLPLGVLLGRRVFGAFARSFGVVDAPSTPAVMIGALVLMAVGAAVLGCAAAMVTARRARGPGLLRQQ